MPIDHLGRARVAWSLLVGRRAVNGRPPCTYREVCDEIGVHWRSAPYFLGIIRRYCNAVVQNEPAVATPPRRLGAHHRASLFALQRDELSRPLLNEAVRAWSAQYENCGFPRNRWLDRFDLTLNDRHSATCQPNSQSILRWKYRPHEARNET
jgi:hypothetical protein